MEEHNAQSVKIENLEEELAELRAEVRSLNKWKEHCTLAAAGWGGICMTVMTMGGIIHAYWNEIKHYFADQK